MLPDIAATIYDKHAMADGSILSLRTQSIKWGMSVRRLRMRLHRLRTAPVTTASRVALVPRLPSKRIGKTGGSTFESR